MFVAQFFTAGLIAYALGAVAAAAGRSRWIIFGLPLIGALLELAASAATLLGDSVLSWQFAAAVPLLSYSLRLDALSALFNLALAVLAGAASIYSIGYLSHWSGARLRFLGFFFNLLLAAVTLVFTASGAVFFLIVWEVMALAAYCLVTVDYEDGETRRAAVLFLVMSHAGTAMLLIAFLLTGGGSLDFAALHRAGSAFAPARQGIILVLFFLGFGVKAGIIPVHIWLPAAHPVAPSNISALMSGIVIKTGIYGMARVFFDFFGDAPLWTGMTVLAIGVASGLLGVLYALMEHDLKRLLAFHSIENIGIILIGFGAALMFRTLGRPELAAVALVAGLYHTVNHAVFKCLLFFGAGAVVHATHTRNMEEMGGLIRRMPSTAFYFLAGSIAISGLPPLNGFVSEWLTYQALLAGFGTTETLTRMVFPIAGSLLALTAALAAACFVKAFGITFLALPRSAESENAKEAALSMRAAMAMLALACLGLGIGATWVIRIFDAITEQLVGLRISALFVTGQGMVLASGSSRGGSISTIGIAGLLLALLLTLGLLGLFWRRRRKLRSGPVWDCGLPGLSAVNEFTATAFSKGLRMIFAALFQPRREIQTEFEISPYYPKAIRFDSAIQPAFEKRFYDPLKDWILALASRMRAIQAGSIHAYLGYIFVTLILLLLFGVRS